MQPGDDFPLGRFHTQAAPQPRLSRIRRCRCGGRATPADRGALLHRARPDLLF